MTLEIIVFIIAILLGIVWYWRESKSNKWYRLANKLTHAKNLQMNPANKKGFTHQQPFLLRLVWITMLFALSAAFITLVTPINVFFVQYFVSAIVGALIGSYIASTFIFAQDRTNKENIGKILDKGREIIENLNEGEGGDKVPNEQPEKEIKNTDAIAGEKEVPKSARDRLKDKGMIK